MGLIKDYNKINPWAVVCRRKYCQAVEHFLRLRFPAGKDPSAAEQDEAARAKVTSSYSSFLQHCAESGESRKLELINSLLILHGRGIGFFDLRKSFVACSVMGAAPLFQEGVEAVLLTAAEAEADALPSGVGWQDGERRLANVSPLLFDFFSEADPVAEGQAQEIKKCLDNLSRGSLQYAAEFYVKVSACVVSKKGNFCIHVNEFQYFTLCILVRVLFPSCSVACRKT